MSEGPFPFARDSPFTIPVFPVSYPSRSGPYYHQENVLWILCDSTKQIVHQHRSIHQTVIRHPLPHCPRSRGHGVIPVSLLMFLRPSALVLNLISVSSTIGRPGGSRFRCRVGMPAVRFKTDQRDGCLEAARFRRQESLVSKRVYWYEKSVLVCTLPQEHGEHYWYVRVCAGARPDTYE